MVTTRHQASMRLSIPGGTATATKVPETLAERRSRWASLLLKEHYQPVIQEVLAEELPKYENSALNDKDDRVALLRECALILASAPSVFSAAVEGNLTSRILEDFGLRQDYNIVQQRAHSQPSIYIHLLADDQGIAPTPNQYMIVREIILDYIAEDQRSKDAWAIDSVTIPKPTPHQSSTGYRKYLHTNSRSERRVTTLHALCNGIQQRWLETPPGERDTPFQFPPGECGYSKNSHTRLAQHRDHKSSNYVMNLVEDICTHLYRTKRFAQHFRMHQFIIYLIFRPSQAAIAEIFCSGLLQVWVENGGGFTAYPAGRSVASAKTVSEDEWDNHELWTRGQSSIDQNISLQKERADQWCLALNWRVEDEEEKMQDAE